MDAFKNGFNPIGVFKLFHFKVETFFLGTSNRKYTINVSSNKLMASSKNSTFLKIVEYGGDTARKNLLHSFLGILFICIVIFLIY